jgi:hypothetical protein
MKTILYSGALLVLFAFSSCKKDYTCQCVASNGQGNDVTTNTVIHDSEDNASDACKALNSSSTAGGFTITNTCSIK